MEETHRLPCYNAEHLREYLAELEDDEKWDETFAKSQDKLVYAAREARKQIAEGKSNKSPAL